MQNKSFDLIETQKLIVYLMHGHQNLPNSKQGYCFETDLFQENNFILNQAEQSYFALTKKFYST